MVGQVSEKVVATLVRKTEEVALLVLRVETAASMALAALGRWMELALPDWAFDRLLWKQFADWYWAGQVV
jgi:hypothetical protein